MTDETTDLQALATRIQEVIQKGRAEGKTQKALADFCNVKPAAVSNWQSRGQISDSNLSRMARFYGVNEHWLRTGESVLSMDYEEPIPEGYSSIPAYELRLGANNCAVSEPEWEELHCVKPVILPDEVFQRHGVNPARCRQAIVCGDSMEPFLMDGDKVVFYEFPDPRPGVNPIIDGKIYVISVDGACRVKRLYKVRGGFQVVSDNPASPAETFVGEACDQLRIYGRVIYVTRDAT